MTRYPESLRAGATCGITATGGAPIADCDAPQPVSSANARQYRVLSLGKTYHDTFNLLFIEVGMEAFERLAACWVMPFRSRIVTSGTRDQVAAVDPYLPAGRVKVPVAYRNGRDDCCR